MIVNLIEKNQIFTTILPERIQGQYWLKDLDENGMQRELMSIEAKETGWIAKSNRIVSIINGQSEFIPEMILHSNSIFSVKISNMPASVLIYCEPLSENRQKMTKYVVPKSCMITIGREPGNTIIYKLTYVSSQHVRLSYTDGRWTIQDLGSTNGTYVNDRRVVSAALNYGDRIYIMGLKIVVGKQFISMNNPDQLVEMANKMLNPFPIQSVNLTNFQIEERQDTCFYRSPRFKQGIQPVKIQVDSPPQRQNQDTTPMALLLGPSMTMGLASASTGIFTLNNVMSRGGDLLSALPSLIMSGSMLLGTVLWPILTKRYEKKQKRKNEQLRQDKYLHYLDSIRDEIRMSCHQQAERLKQNILSSEECLTRVYPLDSSLWERILGQDDFLQLRLGVGDQTMLGEIHYPEKRFTLDDDYLQNALFSLKNEPQTLKDVPIAFNFKENQITGLVGLRSQLLQYIYSLLIQTTIYHSYDELKLVLFVDEEEAKDWQFAKWLPHQWTNDKTFRYYAENVEELKELSARLETELSDRFESKDEKAEFSPYYFIICSSHRMLEKSETIKHLLSLNKNIGVSFVFMMNEIRELPKETQSVIQVEDEVGRYFNKNDLSGQTLTFQPEFSSRIKIEEMAKRLANIALDLESTHYQFPKMVQFLEMFNVGKIEQLNILNRWHENNPTKSLQTPVGLDIYGEPFMLDLHEKFHGPHGLVAGMTGSGKSEFLLTYILSLAINYHPDEVSFILIDYKGGGLAGAFENELQHFRLPHLAGTITNLDKGEVHRALTSIDSELRRRQRVFNEARKATNEGTMDIYRYQQLYRDHVVKEPVPHLFIISDEFAELKSQQPEFMEQLISTARIGRSLGVHLILATQKPSGVVDDQIWSNSRFRVCLKVQEKADSMEMIKVPDAAAIAETGRFYLQVGYNEMFAMGQSAYSGASYVPQERIEKYVDSNIELINHNGQPVKEIKVRINKQHKGKKEVQIVSLVRYLSDLAKKENIHPHSLWLPSMPAVINADELIGCQKSDNKNELCPVIGMLDDPYNQNQRNLTLPLSRRGNCLIYGSAGSGTSLLLTTILYSLIKTHQASALHCYLLDFGSETLKDFKNAPQIGDVILSHESEKISNLFKMLQEEMQKRKELISEMGGNYASYCALAEEPVHNILVVINNYSAFREAYEEANEELLGLTRDGINCGIYFILTASLTNAVWYQLSQNFGQRLVLQMNDPNDYSILLGRTDGLQPANMLGRGLVQEERLLEFQTATCPLDQQELRKYCQQLRSESKTIARKVPILPDRVTLFDFEYEPDLHHLPIGIQRESLAPVMHNLGQSYVMLITGTDIQASAPVLRGIIAACQIIKDVNLQILDGDNIISEGGSSLEYIKKIEDLFYEVRDRNNRYKETGDVHVLDNESERVVILTGYSRIVSLLDADGKENLSLILEKGEAYYKIHFILMDSLSTLSSITAQSWYKRHVNGNGLWIGNGFGDQYLLKVSKTLQSYYEEIGEQFGYWVKKGKAVCVKLIEEEDDDHE